MSHPEQILFFNSIKQKYPSFFENVKVLEVGSLNINGTIRDMFSASEYIGIDVGAGPGVDIIAQGQNFDYPDGYFDTVVSAECFEHNPYWLETFLNMIRMTKSGGLVVFSCASTGREEHGTNNHHPLCSPLTIELGWEYYKNLEESDFTSEIEMNKYFSHYNFIYNPGICDLYFNGIKI